MPPFSRSRRRARGVARSPADAAIAAAWLAAALAAQEPAPPGAAVDQDAPPRIAAAEAVLQATLDSLSTSGAGLVLMRDGERVHESTAGTWRTDQVVPIASATKWLTVATVLTLVDSGQLALDTKVASVLPAFHCHEDVTLEHCLSCTHGLSGRALFHAERDATLDDLATAIAKSDAHEKPGTALRYGTAGFVVAARMAEVAGEASWHELFRARIAEPLGMQHTRYGQIRDGKVVDAGTTPSPWVAGGAESTLDDYAHFVAMLQLRGVRGEDRVLHADSVDTMFRSRTEGLTIEFSPYGKSGEVGYGLGTWIESRNDEGQATLVSDGGAFGWMPWLDLEHGVAGVFAVRDRWKHVSKVFVPRRLELSEAVRKDD